MRITLLQGVSMSLSLQVRSAAANAAASAFVLGHATNFQVEDMERRSFAYIASEFGDQSAFQQQLLDWVYR